MSGRAPIASSLPLPYFFRGYHSLERYLVFFLRSPPQFRYHWNAGYLFWGGDLKSMSPPQNEYQWVEKCLLGVGASSSSSSASSSTAKFETFITRHGCRVIGSPRYQNDQCNEAHLFSAKLETFITRRGYVRFRWNLVRNDPRNQAHLFIRYRGKKAPAALGPA